MNQCVAGLLAFFRTPRRSKPTGLTHGISQPVPHESNADDSKHVVAADGSVRFGECLAHLELRRQCLEKILRETPYVHASSLEYSSEDEEGMTQTVGDDNVCTICGECINGVCFAMNDCRVHFGCREQLAEKIRMAKSNLTLIPELRSLRRYIKRCRWQAQKME